MDTFAKGIALTVLVCAGYLITNFLKRFNIVIKHPVITSLALWAIGFPLLMSNIDNIETSTTSTFFSIVGFIITFIAAAIGYSYMLNPPVHPRQKETRTERVVTKLTENTLHFLFSKPKKNMKTCPFCAEQINIDAIKCRYCGEWFKDKDQISN